MNSAASLDAYQDVDALFRRHHVGEIDRMMRKLEYHRLSLSERGPSFS